MSNIWQKDKGFRMGFIRYGRYIDTIHLSCFSFLDGDMELIGENCTQLRRLDLSGTNITAETLKVLIHSDPYNTLPASSKKRKRKSSLSYQNKRINGNDGDHESDEGHVEESVDVNAVMANYRALTETETEPDTDHHHNYESVGPEQSTATESEQEQQRQHQPTGPIFQPRRSSRVATQRKPQLLPPATIPPHRRAGTTRPAKFKGTKTQFPYFLEELILNRCNELSGKSCLAVISLLGPQLKSLSLNHIVELNDNDLIAMMKHCPNLEKISLKGTEISDKFLWAISGMGDNELQERKLTKLNVDMTRVTHIGLGPVISSNVDKLISFSSEHQYITDEVLYAFVERPEVALPYFRKLKDNAATKAPSTNRIFTSNTVLTGINLCYCSGKLDKGLKALFEFATELMSIKLEGCQVTEQSLLELASTNRKRMIRLGYGVPKAWHDHESRMSASPREKNKTKPNTNGIVKDDGKGKKKASQKKASQKNTIEEATELTTTTTTANTKSTTKIYTNGYFPGGLQQLVLKNCNGVNNKSLRHIVRSCVNLEELNIADCNNVTIEIFNGPWSCLAIKNLNVSGIRLEGSLDVMEELDEKRRFPTSIPEDYIGLNEFNKHGYYENIVQNEENDEDSDTELDMDVDSDDVEPVLPKILNTADQRRTLREFYTKLGQFTQLIQLNTAYGNYRIRVEDGLDLALPGLQQNLLVWNLARPIGYEFGSEEMKWFGKNFGFGFDFVEDGKDYEQQKNEIKIFNDRPKEAKISRVSKLRSLMFLDSSLEGMESEVYDWFFHQGIEVDYVDCFEYSWDLDETFLSDESE
ncbi:hypothetical protein BGZ76_000095 [Entomortierella beljakovae]|nr:hypothetical protein BGZ76_000095 [Entomortierella beljakovae]